MSAAKPLSSSARTANYSRQNGGGELTARQWRRTIQKARRMAVRGLRTKTVTR